MRGVGQNAMAGRVLGLVILVILVDFCVASWRSHPHECDSTDLVWTWAQNLLFIPTRCQMLMLANRGFRDAGAIALANSLRTSNVSVLTLTDNAIGPTGAGALALSLQMGRCGLPSTPRAPPLSLLTHFSSRIPASVLRQLSVSNNPIGDEGCIALAEALGGTTFLTVLEVGHAGIGRLGAAALGMKLSDPLCQLQTLDMSG